MDNNQLPFFELLRAGLWEQEVRLSQCDETDFKYVYRIAEEQSVIGLIAAGLEHVKYSQIPKEDILTFIGFTLQLEQRNAIMNTFIAKLFEELQSNDVKPLLVKGQGIAQCYIKPQWRSPGDIDLFFDSENYVKAKHLLSPKATSVDKEKVHLKHLGLSFDSISVELHGTFRATISRKMDAVLDRIQKGMFNNNEFRTWGVNDTNIILPSPDNDVIFVFSHILQHFFKGGIGIRQICDWTRLLWTYRDSIDHNLLESRLKEMRLLSEWRVFGAISVNVLGLPNKAFPLYKDVNKKKVQYLLSYILEMGNFGHNRDLSFQRKGYPAIIRKFLTVTSLVKVNVGMMRIFPIDTLRFLLGYVYFKLKEQ